MTKCFSYCINQNVGDSNSLKKGLKNIVPHAFGDHSCCDNTWCGYKQNPAAYKHTELPYGKDLFGDSLKKALTDILDEYSTDIVVNEMKVLTALSVRTLKHVFMGVVKVITSASHVG